MCTKHQHIIAYRKCNYLLLQVEKNKYVDVTKKGHEDTFCIESLFDEQSDMYNKRQTQKVKCMIQKTCIKCMYICI